MNGNQRNGLNKTTVSMAKIQSFSKCNCSDRDQRNSMLQMRQPVLGTWMALDPNQNKVSNHIAHSNTTAKLESLLPYLKDDF